MTVSGLAKQSATAFMGSQFVVVRLVGGSIAPGWFLPGPTDRSRPIQVSRARPLSTGLTMQYVVGTNAADWSGGCNGAEMLWRIFYQAAELSHVG